MLVEVEVVEVDVVVVLDDVTDVDVEVMDVVDVDVVINVTVVVVAPGMKLAVKVPFDLRDRVAFCSDVDERVEDPVTCQVLKR